LSKARKPQLPPNRSIELDDSLHATSDKWFEYPIIVHPHHTDYGGIVWHGTYLTWMEEARVEYLRSLGLDYAHFVHLGYELPVVEVNLRYHQSLKMGEQAIVKTRMNDIRGVRLNWDYQIADWQGLTVYVSGYVTLVGIDREKGKIMRRLPSLLEKALIQL
jgi:acyl-CoA thioester hydrolase